MSKDPAAAEVQKRLFALRDEEYQAFTAKLIPNIPPERVIGVRSPAVKALAKELKNTPLAEEFMQILPHEYNEEYILHGLLLSEEKDFEKTVSLLDAFLPFVDNWAVCDSISPKAFKKADGELTTEIRRWLASGRDYTVRYALGCLMKYFLDDKFRPEYLDLAVNIESGEYYVNMMRAWYLATALAKQYDSTVPILEEKRLDRWTHNKTIQKAVESFRVSVEHKEYLKTLRY